MPSAPSSRLVSSDETTRVSGWGRHAHSSTQYVANKQHKLCRQEKTLRHFRVVGCLVGCLFCFVFYFFILFFLPSLTIHPSIHLSIYLSIYLSISFLSFFFKVRCCVSSPFHLPLYRAHLIQSHLLLLLRLCCRFYVVLSRSAGL